MSDSELDRRTPSPGVRRIDVTLPTGLVHLLGDSGGDFEVFAGGSRQSRSEDSSSRTPGSGQRSRSRDAPPPGGGCLVALLEMRSAGRATSRFVVRPWAWSLLEARQAIQFHLSAARAENRLRTRLRQEFV